jgi:hypothetical protein
VSYTYHGTVHGLRTGLGIQQPTASFAVTNAYDAAKRLTGVALNSVRSGMVIESPEPQKSPKLKLRRCGMVRGRCPGPAARWLQRGVRRRRRAGLQDSGTSGPHVAPTELYREGAGWYYNHAAPLELKRAGRIGALLTRSDQYNPGTGAWGRHVFYHADGNGNVTHTVPEH